ncbi:MAG: hypothetical protein AAFY76_13475 [Cyanobacteria bacterium J06649_11]
MKSTNTTFATGRIIGLIKVIFVLFLFAQGIGVSYGQSISLDDGVARSGQDSTSNDSVHIEVIIEQTQFISPNYTLGDPVILSYHLYDSQNTLIYSSGPINQATSTLPYLDPDTYLIVVNTDRGIASKRFNNIQ